MLFRARQFEIVFPRPTLVMGIVNVTPDSFSDGGKFLDVNAAVAHALKLIEQGAEILDIGGESTRPGAKPVSEKEELRRVIPVIEKLAAEIRLRWGETPSSPNQKGKSQGSRDSRPTARQILISIDTMKPCVARAALQAGASIVNDVGANSRGRVCENAGIQKNHIFTNAVTGDEMWKIVSEFRAGYICMHAPRSSGTGISPVNLHNMREQSGQAGRLPHYKNVLREVKGFFQERLEKLTAAGILPEQIIFDPGIGFGKTLEQNLQLLGNLRRFTKLQRPLLLGVSRKSFIEKLSGAPVNERLPASLACAILAIEAGAQLVRTHDVTETVQAVRMAEVVLARKEK
ncbi:MAG: dihydropteroate synthase [Limisphaerales bacterium]